MIIECPKCKKKYKVEDSDIPVGGGPIRCPNCSNIFTVYREPLNIKLISIVEEGVEFQPSVAKTKERLTRLKEEVFPDSWGEEKKEKHKKAQRLGKSLANDILLYNKEKVERGRREGNLVQLLQDEIKKSWNFYKNHVEHDVLLERNYFKEALNGIIAGGKEVFK